MRARFSSKPRRSATPVLGAFAGVAPTVDVLDAPAGAPTASTAATATIEAMLSASEIERLPGGDIVRQGLIDLADGRETVEAAAVAMASRRLSGLGFSVPTLATDTGQPAAHRLYGMLAHELGNGAHSRYNAIVRRLVSFVRIAERETER